MDKISLRSRLRILADFTCSNISSTEVLPVVEELLVDDILKDSNIESILVELYANHAVENMSQLVKELCLMRWIFGLKEYIQYVAWACVNRYLGQEDSARLLGSVPYLERADLGKPYNDLLTVADLVVEDSNDGFKKVGEDRYFIDAIGLLADQIGAPQFD